MFYKPKWLSLHLSIVSAKIVKICHFYHVAGGTTKTLQVLKSSDVCLCVCVYVTVHMYVYRYRYHPDLIVYA